jgi:ParB/RepB/Spo0J family partition protein
MNAPTRAIELAQPTVELIPLASITPSATHIQELRRGRFTKEGLKDLAESIAKLGGVLQPIVVRPVITGAATKTAKFEIVAGERRWLATKQAGLTSIQATVRPLTDEEVLEVQLIENLQREGLHELEEAEGYDELMKLKKINADQLVDMVGKSRSYIYARLKLLALCPEARKAFYAGELDASRALLIARIGHHDTQRAALKDVTLGEAGYGGRRDNQPMSYREAHKHIVDTYMLVLKSAPFDITDAALVAKAGDCIKCPKRTGNQADLFGDVKNADVCTDPKCFDDKRQAHFAAPRLKLEADGKKVIHGDEAKKIFEDWESPNTWARDRMRTNQYVPLSETTYASGRSRKVGELLGNDYQPILIQHPGTGKIIPVATQQAVTKAASSNGKSKSKPSAGAGAYNYDAKQKARELEQKMVEEIRASLFAAVHAKLKAGLASTEILHVVRYLATGNVDTNLIGKLWGWKVGGYDHRALVKHAQKLNAVQLMQLAFELALSAAIEDDYDDAPLIEHAKRLKIDTQAIADEVKARLTPKKPVDKVNAAIEKRAAKAKGKAKASGKKKAAAKPVKAKGKKK